MLSPELRTVRPFTLSVKIRGWTCRARVVVGRQLTPIRSFPEASHCVYRKQHIVEKNDQNQWVTA